MGKVIRIVDYKKKKDKDNECNLYIELGDKCTELVEELKKLKEENIKWEK